MDKKNIGKSAIVCEDSILRGEVTINSGEFEFSIKT